MRIKPLRSRIPNRGIMPTLASGRASSIPGDSGPDAMKNSEADLIAAARAARTHRPDLIQENPSEVDARLGELLAEAERGKSVRPALLALITQHPALREFVKNFVAVPESLRSY